MNHASHAALPAVASSPDVPTATFSMASLVSVLGALLLLLACTLPMVGAGFAADGLTAAMMPQKLVETPARHRGAEALAGLGLASPHATRAPATTQAAHATEALRSDLRSHGDTLSLAELGAGLLDAHHIVASWRATANADVDATSRGHVVGLRLTLAALALLVGVALATGLWSLGRKLAAPDTLQLAAQCAFGGVLTAVFGLVAVSMVVDEVARTQLDITGVGAALVGSLLVLGAALSALRPRNLVPVTTLAVVLLVSTTVIVGLGVTI